MGSRITIWFKLYVCERRGKRHRGRRLPPLTRRPYCPSTHCVLNPPHLYHTKTVTLPFEARLLKAATGCWRRLFCRSSAAVRIGCRLSFHQPACLHFLTYLLRLSPVPTTLKQVGLAHLPSNALSRPSLPRMPSLPTPTTTCPTPHAHCCLPPHMQFHPTTPTTLPRYHFAFRRVPVMPSWRLFSHTPRTPPAFLLGCATLVLGYLYFILLRCCVSLYAWHTFVR